MAEYQWYRNKRTGRIYQADPAWEALGPSVEQVEGTFVEGVLPEVTLGPVRKMYDGTEVRELKAGPWGFDLLPDEVPTEEEMLGYIAAYRYVKEHPEVVPEPPVDEGQVRALTRIVDETHTSWDSARLARHLIQHGVRVVDEP